MKRSCDTVDKTIGTLMSIFFLNRLKKGNTSLESDLEKSRLASLDRFSLIILSTILQALFEFRAKALNALVMEK